MEGKHLKDEKDAENGRQSREHFFHEDRYGLDVGKSKIDRIRVAARGFRRYFGCFSRIKKSQQEDGENRSHGAEGNESEAVVLRVLVASDRGDADAQGYDKGRCHRAGGHTPGIKGNADVIGVRQKCQYKNDPVKNNEQPPETDAGQDPDHTQYKKKPDTDGHSKDQHKGINMGYISRQDLEIRLGHCDDDSDQKTDSQDFQNIAGLCEIAPQMSADHDHGVIGTIHKNA